MENWRTTQQKERLRFPVTCQYGSWHFIPVLGHSVLREVLMCYLMTHEPCFQVGDHAAKLLLLSLGTYLGDWVPRRDAMG